MANFTRLHKISDDWRVLDARVEGIPSVVLTDTTIAKRGALKHQLDDFCTFSWNGVDAFETFGVFITQKNALKFYNGPGYSNQYTQPLFTDGETTITGLKFNVQKISFTVGVYWISEEHYRRLLYWLNPYSIGALVFDFEPMWHYNVKLAGIKDSTRTIIGYENSYKIYNPDGEPTTIYEHKPMYYTEITLDFELQGPPCARYNIPYSFVSTKTVDAVPPVHRGIWQDVTPLVINQTTGDEEKPTDKRIYQTYLPIVDSTTTGNISSDLSAGFSVSLPLKFKALSSYSKGVNSDLRILLEAVYTIPSGNPLIEDEEQAVTLMDLNLEKLALIFEEQSKQDPENATFDENNNEIDAIPSVAPVYTFSYNSSDGLTFLRINGEEEKILTKLQTLTHGDRFVKTISTQQFQMPGVFEFPTFKFNNFSIRVSLTGSLMTIVDKDDFLQNTDNADTILMYATTNVI